MGAIILAILISGGIVLLGTGFVWLALELVDFAINRFDKQLDLKSIRRWRYD